MTTAGGARATTPPGSAAEGAGPARSALLGFAWMLVCTLLFGLADAWVKRLGSEVHPFEVGFFRNVFGLLLLLPILIHQRWRPLRTRRIGLIVVRGVLGAAATLSAYLGITMSPLAKGISLSFTAPLVTVFFATLVLGEAAGARRWLAVFTGFLGTMVILRPGLETVQPGSALMLFSAVFNGLIVVVVKVLTRTESSLTITTWMAIAVGVVTLPPALLVWSWPTPEHYGWLVAIAATASAGQYAMAQALRAGEASLLIPMDFLRLIWVSILGVVMFAEVPDGYTVAGAVVILLANVHAAWPQRQSR